MTVVVARYPTKTSSAPIIRGAPCSMVFPITEGGAEVDISTWTWRAHTRPDFARDAALVSACDDFDVVTRDDFPVAYPGGGTTPSILVVNWSADQTWEWDAGMVLEVEQLTPIQFPWFIAKYLRVQGDVAHGEDGP